jgi:NAD-dependent deacetylase
MMLSQEVKNYIIKNFKKGNVACLTGAGISVESGIPTFRGKGGLWEKYDPEIFANAEGLVQAFRKSPQRVIDFITDLYSVLLSARPNPAHLGLSVLEKEGILNSVITQNIDNLHQEAGSRNVIELHGNAHRIRCAGCSKTVTLEKDRMQEMVSLLKKNRGSRIKLLKVLSRYFPRCACGFRYRIDIVLFGEMLPEKELTNAYQSLGECRVLLIIGSSLVVYPAAGLPLYAKQKGATLIEINNEESSLSQFCDYKIIGKASETLPEILRILGN